MIAAIVPVDATTGAVYRVDPAGDDAADGRRRPWRTLARASRAAYRPGDRIVLAAGARFVGSLSLPKGVAGTAARPIAILSDQTRPATIVSSEAPAVELRGGGFAVSDLVLRGEAKGKRDGHDGFLLAAPGGARQAPVLVERVDVAGFGGAGVSVTGAKDSPDGFDGVTLRNVNARANFGAGIVTGDTVSFLLKGPNAGRHAHRNLLVRDCDASENLGGTGIVISGFDGGVVEFCSARNNRGPGGGVGIWSWCVRNLAFRHCLAAGTRSGAKDGGGFDLDGGSDGCVVERCLSYENDGPGFMHCDFPASPPTRGNAFRRSLSVDDGRQGRGDNTGFGFVTWGSGLYDCRIESNVALATAPDALRRERGLLFSEYIRSSEDPPEAQRVTGGVVRGNVVEAGPGWAFVHNALVKTARENVRFDGNRYVGAGIVREGHENERRYAGIAEWRAATGQEPSPVPAGGAVGAALSGYRALSPRDLPRFFDRLDRAVPRPTFR